MQAFGGTTNSLVGPPVTSVSNCGTLQPKIIQQIIFSSISTLRTETETEIMSNEVNIYE